MNQVTIDYENSFTLRAVADDGSKKLHELLKVNEATGGPVRVTLLVLEDCCISAWYGTHPLHPREHYGAKGDDLYFPVTTIEIQQQVQEALIKAIEESKL